MGEVVVREGVFTRQPAEGLDQSALPAVPGGGGGGSRTPVRKQWQPGYYMLVSPLDLVEELSGEREPFSDQPLDLVAYA